MNISVGNLVLPNKPLSNIELLEAARKLKIPNFRGVSLRDTLPKKPKKKECGILNLDDTSGLGTHWVAWYKNGTEKKYFDSYGLQPPNELVDYLRQRRPRPPYIRRSSITPKEYNLTIRSFVVIYVSMF